MAAATPGGQTQCQARRVTLAVGVFVRWNTTGDPDT